MADKEAINQGLKNRKRSRKFNLTTLLVVLALIASFGASIYFWQDARDAKRNSPDSIAAKNQQESSEIIDLLSNVLLIESESEPTVARVEDPETLINANPDFYSKVVVGDYLILYPQRAIIFRANESKVINVAPIIDASRLNGGDQQP